MLRQSADWMLEAVFDDDMNDRIGSDESSDRARMVIVISLRGVQRIIPLCFQLSLLWANYGMISALGWCEGVQ